MKKIFKTLQILIFLCIISGVFLFNWFKQEINKQYNITTPIEITIPRGTTMHEIANILEQNKLIKDNRLFRIYAKISNISHLFKAGDYVFIGNINLIDIANKITQGKVITRSQTIPEGLTIHQIKEIVTNNEYLTGEITLDLQEGNILPETYHFEKGQTRDNFLLNAKNMMNKELKKAFENRAPNLPIKSEQELLILASIIEKETGKNNERTKVASVFVNRLNLGMRLQTDPTIIYAVTDGKMNLERPLYKRDLKVDSPYNTYIYTGLTPTPICNPGKEAIKAAANPDNTKYIYFVADGLTGGHLFAKTLAEHNKNVQTYKKNLKKK